MVRRSSCAPQQRRRTKRSYSFSIGFDAIKR
jgi:hypothetical protein